MDMVKPLANLAGFILIGFGALWTLQGFGWLGVRLLVADPLEWIFVGVMTAAAGIGLMCLVNWRPRPAR